MNHKLLLLAILLLSVFLLSGCGPDESTLPPADGGPAGGYPAPLSSDEAYPAQDNTQQPGPPSGAPVRVNAVMLNVEILTLTQSATIPDTIVIHVRVISSAPVAGKDAYDANLTGKELDINLAAGDAADLATGDVINLTVSYRGDEWGGGYYGYDITLP